MIHEEKELREEFQNFADSIPWSNDDGSEKYIGVGNMADWWLKKIQQAVAEERESVIKEIQELTGEMRTSETDKILSLLLKSLTDNR